MVAVHNDYVLNGRRFTFWIFTHPSGRYVKGEGSTDAEALWQCRLQASDSRDSRTGLAFVEGTPDSLGPPRDAALEEAAAVIDKEVADLQRTRDAHYPHVAIDSHIAMCRQLAAAVRALKARAA